MEEMEEDTDDEKNIDVQSEISYLNFRAKSGKCNIEWRTPLHYACNNNASNSQSQSHQMKLRWNKTLNWIVKTYVDGLHLYNACINGQKGVVKSFISVNTFLEVNQYCFFF